MWIEVESLEDLEKRDLCVGGTFNAAPFRYIIAEDRLFVQLRKRLPRDRSGAPTANLDIKNAAKNEFEPEIEPEPEPGDIEGSIFVVSNIIKIIAGGDAARNDGVANKAVAEISHDSQSSKQQMSADEQLKLADPGRHVALLFYKIVTLIEASPKGDDWQVC